MIVYDVATKERDTESFPQHTIADLNSGITFIVLFNQEKPLQWKEINTHTQTHTHTHIHTHENIILMGDFNTDFKNKGAGFDKLSGMYDTFNLTNLIKSETVILRI